MKIGTGKDIFLVWLCTMKQPDMFKLKNILEKSVYCVICSVVASVNVCGAIPYAPYAFIAWCCIKQGKLYLDCTSLCHQKVLLPWTRDLFHKL